MQQHTLVMLVLVNSRPVRDLALKEMDSVPEITLETVNLLSTGTLAHVHTHVHTDTACIYSLMKGEMSP